MSAAGIAESFDRFDSAMRRSPPRLGNAGHANRLYGFSAQKTLDTAQPCMSATTNQLPAHGQPASLAGRGAHAAGIVKTIEADYREFLAPGHW